MLKANRVPACCCVLRALIHCRFQTRILEWVAAHGEEAVRVFCCCCRFSVVQKKLCEAGEAPAEFELSATNDMLWKLYPRLKVGLIDSPSQDADG